MGVFSVNENHFNLGGLPEVEMNEAYTTGVDMAIALVECKQNEFAVLQAGIKQDMCAAVCEDLEERETLNEATVSELGAKIKEILKKLLEKIKSIFHAFMAKVNSFFIDGEEMFKKYSGEIAKKNFSDFKLKVREFKRDKFNDLIKTTLDTTVTIEYDNVSSLTDEELNELMENDKLAEVAIEAVFTDAACKAMSIDYDLGNLEKEVEDYCFEDSEKKDDWSSATIISANWIGGLLTTKKFIEDIEKTNKSVETKIAKLLNDIDKDLRKVAGTVGKDNSSYNVATRTITIKGGDGSKADYSVGKADTKASVAANNRDKTKINKVRSITLLQAKVSKYQIVQIKAQNARLSCAKKAMAQAKKIFAAAVAYNPKKENYDFYTAVAESEEFDAAMALE